jgi:putative DNA primase/helicase
MTSPAVSGVLCRLAGVRTAGRGWIARCPAHDDRRASLSVAEGDDGRVLLRCHAGCSTESVARALGLELRDLFADRPAPPPSAPARRIVATYDYVDEAGTLLYEVVRYAPKDFRQRRPDGRGGWVWGLGDVERVPYRLPEVIRAARDGRVVFIVEGEKDADRLASLGLVATTCPGGAGKWLPEWGQYCAGAHVAILPDNDDVGRRHARDVARSVHAHARSVRIVELPGLPPRGDISDWLDAGHTRDDLTALVRATQPLAEPPEPGAEAARDDDVDQAAWEEPIPLAAAPRLPAYPTDVLPGWLARHVRAVAVATQTAEDMAGSVALAVLATAAGGRVEIEPRPGWREPACLYVLTVADPGERKSAVHADLTAPIREYEREEIERLRPEIEAALSRRRMREQARARAERDAVSARDPEARREAEAEALRIARELADEPEPALPRLVADDATPEALGSLLAEQGGRMAVLSAEGTLFDIVAGRYTDGTPNIDLLLKAHAGDPIRVDRRGRPAEHVPRPALTLGIMAQPEALRGLLRRREFRGRGLLGRILYAMPPSLVGHRETAPPPVPEEVRREYVRHVRALLALPPGTDPQGRPAPHIIRLSPAAHERLVAFEAALEPRLAAGAELGHMRDWAAKLAGAVVRIAGLLHLAEHAMTPAPWTLPIAEETMEHAVRLGEYFLAHARAAYGEMGSDPAVATARYLAEWLTGRGIEELGRRDLYIEARRHGLVNRVEDVLPALDLLLEHGYLRPLPPAERKGPGRPPSPRYAVHPAVARGAISPAQNSQNSQNSGGERDFANIANIASGIPGPEDGVARSVEGPARVAVDVAADGPTGPPPASRRTVEVEL